MEDGSQRRSALDQHLKTQYHQICFDPSRRHTLLNLTAPPSARSQGTHPPLSGPSLNRYIQDVYQKFGIEDPIRKEYRLAQQVHKKSNRTQLKLSQLRTKFQQDNKDVLTSSIVQRGNRLNTTEAQTREQLHSSSSRAKQIGYKTKEKMSFKARTQEDSSIMRDSSTGRHHRRIISPRASISYFNAEDSLMSRGGHSGTRYCPACEESLNEQDQEAHARQCFQLRQAQGKPFQETVQMLRTKLTRLEVDLREQLSRKNTHQMQHSLQDLKRGVGNWLRDNKEEQLGPIRFALQSLCLGVHQRVLKVRCFREMLGYARREGGLPPYFK